jgi:putative ABC transport system permease protein
VILKWALRDVLRSWRLSLFFVFNMSLGLTGTLSIEAFKESLQSFLRDNAKNILSADLTVSARRNLTEKELLLTRQIIKTASPQHKESLVYEFFSMAGTGQGSSYFSTLVEVKAIDSSYPFYGTLTLESGEIITSESPKSIMQGPFVWAYPELKHSMGLKKNDEITLGKLKLRVNDFVREDTTQTFRSSSMAPKIYIDRTLLKDSGLMQYGSTFNESFLYKIEANDPKAEIDEAQLTSLQKDLQQELTDPTVQINTAKTAGEDSGRQLKYLSDFLGLAALIAIFLSSLGMAYIFQLFLSQKLKEIAIFRSLGLTPGQTLNLFVLQATILGLFAIIPSFFSAQIFIPLLSRMISLVTPFSILPKITFMTITFGSIGSILLSLLVCLPFIVQIRHLHPAQLLREEKSEFRLTRVQWWLFLPSLAVFWIFSILQSNSFKTGSIFFGALVIVIMALAFFGWVGLVGLDLLKPRRDWRINYSLKSLVRKKATSLSIFVTLGIGTLLVNLLPQLKESLNKDLTFDAASAVPSLFLFDIQEEQVDPVKAELLKKGLKFKTLSPLIRSRILKVNGQDYERRVESEALRTREEDQEARTRNRGVNLSYRDQLSDTETIVEGRPFSKEYSPDQEYAEISVELRFADRIGLKIGDRLLFDVQGVGIPAEIVNFRRVKWTSFQPNFFILFQSGVLNEAPKTFIGILPHLEASFTQRVMSDLVQKFGNISMVDVSRLIKSILKLAEQMSWSLELMAALAFLAGYIVLYSIVRSQVRQRRWELNMLKILGAGAGSLRVYLLNEFLILSLAASVFGVGLSFLVSGLMMKFIFEAPVVFSFWWAGASVLMVPILASAVSYWASRTVLNETPAVLLRE